MKQFYVVKKGTAADFLVEAESFEGVKLIAETVAEDIKEVSDVLPAQKQELQQCSTERVILMATVNKSPLLERLETEGRLSLEQIRGKREVYLMQLIETPFSERPEIKELLVIAGSDKRGTIYGMFH